MNKLTGTSIENLIIELASQLVVDNYKLGNRVSAKYDHGVLFQFEIRAENFGFENDGNTQHEEWMFRETVWASVLVVYPHLVFVSFVGDYEKLRNNDKLPPIESFKCTSTHDSCWRSDGLSDIWKETKKLAYAAREKTPKEHQDALDDYVSIDIGNFIPFIRPVMIEKERNETTWGYTLKKLTVKKQVLGFVDEKEQEE